jgi:hypothetical protein
MPIRTDDQWFGGGGGGVTHPVGPLGHAQTVLSSSTAATTSGGAPNQLRTLARAMSARRQARRPMRRIMW